MHVATQLKAENLHVKVDKHNAQVNDIFPEPQKFDRYGFVVHEPYGGLGASLLIQAAIVQFYDLRPERGDTEPMYPEIYLFHVGGRFGDHSSFDFWPPRKEVFLPADKPYELLSALVDRGITRLAIPDIPPGETARLREGASSFADLGAAKNLLTSCYAYTPSGQIDDANLVLESSDHNFEKNAEWTLNADIILEAYKEDPSAIYKPGPTVDSDIDLWVHRLADRKKEVDRDYAKKLLMERRKMDGDDLIRRESFRSLDFDQALRMLAAL